MSEEVEVTEEEVTAPEVESNDDATAEQTSEQADSEGEAATPAGDDATAKPKKSGVQERINELTRQRHDKERALDAAKQEAEYWKAQAIQKPEEPQQSPVATGKPESDQFDSYEEYLEALSDYKVDQRLTANRVEQEQQAQRQQLASKQQAFNQKAEKLEIDDFVDVVYNPDLVLSEDMIGIAFDSDKGPEILYYLGKNPTESARIAALTPVQAARELGRLEASITLPPAKTLSAAPPPITPISGGGEPPQMDQDKMTPEQWRDWRNEQLRGAG